MNTDKQSTKVKEKELHISGASFEQIEEWKARYGKDSIHHIKVPKDSTYEEFLHCIVRTPKPGVINEYLRKAERVPLDANKTLLNTIWLHGDDIIKKETTFLNSACARVMDLVIGGEAEMVKL